jgi:hypothetical protein
MSRRNFEVDWHGQRHPVSLHQRGTGAIALQVAQMSLTDNQRFAAMRAIEKARHREQLLARNPLEGLALSRRYVMAGEATLTLPESDAKTETLNRLAIPGKRTSDELEALGILKKRKDGIKGFSCRENATVYDLQLPQDQIEDARRAWHRLQKRGRNRARRIVDELISETTHSRDYVSKQLLANCDVAEDIEKSSLACVTRGAYSLETNGNAEAKAQPKSQPRERKVRRSQPYEASEHAGYSVLRQDEANESDDFVDVGGGMRMAVGKDVLFTVPGERLTALATAPMPHHGSHLVYVKLNDAGDLVSCSIDSEAGKLWLAECQKKGVQPELRLMLDHAPPEPLRMEAFTPQRSAKCEGMGHGVFDQTGMNRRGRELQAAGELEDYQREREIGYRPAVAKVVTETHVKGAFGGADFLAQMAKDRLRRQREAED